MKPKYNISQDEVSAEIDLTELFGVKVNDADTRRLIAEDLIQKMIDRNDNNLGVNISSGKEVKLKSPYSKEYSESLTFKAHDKSRGDVNMKLTGSMRASIDLISDSSKKLKIGIDNEDTPKAFNHQTGDTVTKRPFFGVTKDDLNEIRDKYIDEVVPQAITAGDIFSKDNFAAVFKAMKKSGVI